MGLPPLPTLAPLPRLKPLAPMPGLPWDDDPPPLSWPVAPPPPANHPAAEPSSAFPSTQSPYPFAAAKPVTDPVAPSAAPSAPSVTSSTGEPLPDPPAAALPAAAPSGSAASPAAAQARLAAGALPRLEAQPAADALPFEEQRPTATEPLFAAAPSGSGAATPGGEVSATVTAGRHASASPGRQDDALPFAPGLRVLVVGGAEPLGGMVTERLIAAGHRLAVQGVTIPSELPPSIEVDGAAYRAFEPIPLAGDRSDSEEMVHTVARAEVALGGLDALVMLPAQHSSGAGLDADASTWADEWSLALTTEVLAAASATHIAARSFLARRKAGRIVLVTNGLDGAQSGAMPASATRAALSRLGVDLTRELSPHGIGVSVVATGTGGTRDFAVAQVADVVEALLSTPVLSGVSSQIG